MADAISKLTTVVGLTKLQHIKESKMYKALAGKKGTDRDGSEIADVGTWDGFCAAIGTSRQKVDEDLTNLRIFGEEAMDNLTRIGAGYRELRQLRKLPTDERTALIEAAKTGDKDELLDLAESLIAKHTKEKETLTKDLTEATENYEAQGAVLKKKDETLNKLEKQLHKLQNRAGDWHPRATEIAIETTRHAAATLEGLDKLDAMRNAIMNEEFGDQDREAAIEAMAVVYYDSITQIVNRIAEVADACDEVFIGHKEKARPMLDVEAFMPKAEEKPATKAKK
jgi:chromosome segregation ATPase